MYRLIGPKLIFFLPIVLVGIVIVAIIPKYYGAIRVLSFTALLLGEAGLSFLPVLSLYPKATPFQAALLAIIFFFTTFIICFSSSVLNSIGIVPDIAFSFKGNEFVINTHSLFAANLFSFLALIINFKLVYDEELTKATISRRKEAPYKGRGSFMPFQKTLLNRPTRGTSETLTATKKEKQGGKSFQDPFEDEFTRPFEFEVETSTHSPETLPEESSGKLFAPEKKVHVKPSEFFEEEESPFATTIEPMFKESKKELTLTEKPKEVSPFPPSNMMEDLQAIFEQYSSLNAVKKLTATKSEKLHEYKRRKIESQESKAHSEGKKQQEQGEVEVFDATYRQVTEEEKLLELKEELKRQLEEELHEKLMKESAQREEVKGKESQEVIKSIEAIKDELKKEIENKVRAELNLEQKAEKETSHKKEELIQTLRKELIESLREEFKKRIVPTQDLVETVTKKEISREEAEKYKNKISRLKENPTYSGLVFLDLKGDVIYEDWLQKPVLQGLVTSSLIQLFVLINKEMDKTSQGKLLHILLESRDGTLVVAGLKNQVLAVHTMGTGEAHSGSLLKGISEIEDS